MSELLEIFMIVSFGFSWPMNVIKSWKARTTKGKSLAFLILIFFGYICAAGSHLQVVCSVLLCSELCDGRRRSGSVLPQLSAGQEGRHSVSFGTHIGFPVCVFAF